MNLGYDYASMKCYNGISVFEYNSRVLAGKETTFLVVRATQFANYENNYLLVISYACYFGSVWHTWLLHPGFYGIGPLYPLPHPISTKANPRPGHEV